MIFQTGLILLLLLTGVPDAQHTRDAGFPFIQNYTADEYASHVQNWGFCMDQDGLLYVANIAGPMVFNGKNWEHYNIPNTLTYSMQSAPDGRIFVGGDNEIGYLQYPENGLFRSTASLEYVSLREMIPDTLNFGAVWQVLVYENTTYFRGNQFIAAYDGDEIRTYSTPARYTEMFVRNGSVHVAEHTRGIKKLGGDEPDYWETGAALADELLHGYVQLENSELFCSPFRCLELDGNQFREFKTEADSYLNDNIIDEVLKLQDGTLLFGTRRGGLVHLKADGTLIRTITESTGLINNTVYGIFEDQAGSVWVATVNGLARVDVGLPFRRFDERYGIQDVVTRIRSAGDDGYLLSTRGGAYFFHPGNEATGIETGSSCNQIFDYKNDLFLICEGRIYRYHNQQAEQIKSRLSVSYTSKLYGGKELIMFTGTYAAIVRIEGSDVEIVYEFEGLNWDVNSIVADKKGNIWLGTDSDGLKRIRLEYKDEIISGHQIMEYLDDLPNPAGNKRVSVAYLNNEPAFLTWGAGIQRFNHQTESFEQEARFGEIFTEADRQIFRAVQDPNGNVWFRSGQRYQAAVLLEEDTYELKTGVLNMVRDRQNSAIYPDDQGFVWFVTDRGLIRYDTYHEYEISQPFHTQLKRVIVKGDTLAAAGHKNPLSFEYSENELRFTYAAGTYQAPEETRYRVKLEGFDSDWSAWTSETFKDYTNIREGNYSFAIEARNVYGTISASEPFAFSIRPPWYRTWWAYLLYALISGTILYSAYRVRVNQLLRVERIRNRIAGDLHDEISATLSSISFFAKAIESEHKNSDPKRFVRLISESAGDAKEKITDIVWAVNPEHDDWNGFLAKCRRFATDLLDSSELKYEIQIQELYSGKLDMQLRQHLWMIFKEMVTNVVRHSKATEMSISINIKNNVLTLRVEDNGIGIPSDLRIPGNGLSNIRRRASEIKATLNLDSAPKKGTRWELKVKV